MNVRRPATAVLTYRSWDTLPFIDTMPQVATLPALRQIANCPKLGSGIARNQKTNPAREGNRINNQRRLETGFLRIRRTNVTAKLASEITRGTRMVDLFPIAWCHHP